MRRPEASACDSPGLSMVSGRRAGDRAVDTSRDGVVFPLLRDTRFSPLAPVIIALIAVLGAGVILFFEPLVHALGRVVSADWAQEFDNNEREFLERGPTTLWLFLLCAQTALWALLVFPLRSILDELYAWRDRATALAGLAALAIPVTAFVVVGALAELERPLWGKRRRL